MRRMNKLLIIAILPLLLSGCWDYKEIQRMNFVTTIGIDYENNQYIVYLLSVSFVNIAKQEAGGKSRAPSSNVIAVARGSSLTEAIFRFYEVEQINIFWGHVLAMVFSKTALQKVGIVDLTDLFNRYREIRYNIWAYGTEENIKELFNISPYFGYSLYDALLMKPNETYKQYSYIKPIYMYRFLSNYYEQGKTAMLPVLSINKDTWSEGEKPSPQMVLSGVYVYANRQFKGELSNKQISGLKYLDESSERFLVEVNDDRRPDFTVVVRKPKYKLKYTIDKGQVYYDLDVKVNVYLDEMLRQLSQKEMVEKLGAQIETEIRRTFQNGVTIGADIFNLNDNLYRYHYGDWKKTMGTRNTVSNVELRNVKVNVGIRYSGKYKAEVTE